VVEVRERISRLFRNRNGAVIAGIVAAVIAIILLVVYLNSYRSSVNSDKAPERVLVATKLISAGTSGNVIAKKGLYTVTAVAKDQLKVNAIVDPAALADRIAIDDIFPGQQLTQDQFSTETQTGLAYQLTGRQRAIAIPVGTAQGVAGTAAAGNFVDIYIGTSGGQGQLVTLLVPDVYVLAAPAGGGGNWVFRIPTKQAAKFAFASDNTKIWLVLRPQVGASRTPPTTATLAELLAGAR
jgi:Flp pilus assembly protein CpaB